MNKKAIVVGVLFIMLGIVLGAFGAHALEKVVSDESLLNAFETGVRYQIYHGLAFMIIGFSKFGNKLKGFSFYSMLAGVILFSGSIYLLVLNFMFDGFLPKMIGGITPIGGACLILAWIIVLIKILKEKQLFVEK
jgi:uncharacterized membrane protein YgdD (TMEM256/DUF423 family)